jgi:hypothetical protein
MSVEQAFSKRERDFWWDVSCPPGSACGSQNPRVRRYPRRISFARILIWQLRDCPKTRIGELLHLCDRTVPTKACARNSLTPGRPCLFARSLSISCQTVSAKRPVRASPRSGFCASTISIVCSASSLSRPAIERIAARTSPEKEKERWRRQ